MSKIPGVGCHFRDLPNPEIEPKSPAFQADSLPSEPPGKPGRWLGSKKMTWVEVSYVATVI